MMEISFSETNILSHTRKTALYRVHKRPLLAKTLLHRTTNLIFLVHPNAQIDKSEESRTFHGTCGCSKQTLNYGFNNEHAYAYHIKDAN